MTNRLTAPAAPAPADDRCPAYLAEQHRTDPPRHWADIPVDWRCVRPLHRGRPVPAAAEHLALPAGPQGGSFRFDDTRAVYPEQADTATPPPPELVALVEQLARRSVGVVRVQPGDTLLLLVPGDDRPDPEQGGTTHADRLVTQLAAYVPQIAILALTGVAGGVVVPAVDQPINLGGRRRVHTPAQA